MIGECKNINFFLYSPGIYDSDPKKNPQAKRFDRITYVEALQRQQVMDATALSLCMDNKMPIIVFDMFPDQQHPAGDSQARNRHARHRLTPEHRIIQSANNLEPERMDIDDILLEAEEKMTKTEQVIIHEFSGVRTNKASPALVENIPAEVYGAQMRIRGARGILPPSRVSSSCSRGTSAASMRSKAIQKLNPQIDKKIIRLILPELSTERHPRS